ncbi:MAG: endo-1,4-beta-xylanase [Myxococcales bacterium]|nr:endo-1,4-beta-xylanase [Myxococcales bacterium]
MIPGNAGKWRSVEAVQGTFDWTELDAEYNFAKANGLRFKFHNLVWGSQQPGWITSLLQAD